MKRRKGGIVEFFDEDATWIWMKARKNRIGISFAICSAKYSQEEDVNPRQMPHNK